jgi:hypothetical protein
VQVTGIRTTAIRSAARRSALAVGLAGAAVAAGGCYDYLPVRQSSSTLPGGEVELALTDSGAVVLARDIGPSSTAIDGTLVGDSAGRFTIAVRQVRRRDADPAPWRGERIGVPHALVASLRTRQLARTRTVLATVGTAAALVLVRTAIAHGGGSNAGGSIPMSGGAK